MGQQIEQLAGLVASTRWEDLPPSARHRTKLILLDSLGVILAGSQQPEVKALAARLGQTAGSGATVLGPGWMAIDPASAALLNGLAGRAIELSEGVRGLQAGIHVVPAVLAVGEYYHSSGRQILEALLCGYEAAARLGLGFTPRAFAHPNGQISQLGSVAAAARLCGLDADGISLAMRIATTSLMTPSYTNTAAGGTTLNLPAGLSCLVATLAPQMALAGYHAQPDAIEEALGRMVGTGFDPTVVATGLGEDWEIEKNYFRLYACCNPIHPALDSLAETLAVLQPRPEQIARIDAETFAFATVMCQQEPVNYFASKYSFPHAAATLIARGGLNFSRMDESSLTDPVIAALRHKVFMSEDPHMTEQGPLLKPARVTLTLTDGRQAVAECLNARRDVHPIDPEPGVRAKFRELAGTVLAADVVRDVEEAVDHAETWSGVADLLDILRRPW
jgi:2-methylcitrate dehydratase PrpD